MSRRARRSEFPTFNPRRGEYSHMKILVLNPFPSALGYALFRDALRAPAARGVVRDVSGADGWREALLSVRAAVDDCAAGAVPYLIGCRVVYGGDFFRGPMFVRPDVVRALEAMVPSAPLHLPPLLALLRACEGVFAGVPVVLVFETSFFTALSPRESAYAISATNTETLAARRYGFHGIFHEAACAQTVALRRVRGAQSPSRTLSICLEPVPEAAAAIGVRPLMTTGGSTPLEGIPGQTTCGEIDPRIVITLKQARGWGHERISQVLTRESGLLGLTGKPVTIAEILEPGKREWAQAREVLKYRILLACGAGTAAMGGLDAIVFSGRYASSGSIIGPWLCEKLARAMPGMEKGNIALEFLRDTVESLVAVRAVAALPASSAAPQRRPRASFALKTK